ncbi:glucans biosynthesis glucosyltransferase MdoH [Limimaricola hongkongensis]|uniref:Glucans biosynthesis glucosyltransferase H n=1 Tax=Limimaricola hongkongensis DSM 17492 TaxID=1122180 RepID=A0A017HDV7_9RHOB|nr:glucans biosynthesis glucosyltransferase MdoH [Limimaricola hongkongensis]EYD72348.1 Glucans biosynthesis glucosyltransferase H [Limimaricola hongkongensis DSM 17492]
MTRSIGPVTRARMVALGASLALAAGAFALFFAQRQTGGLWVELTRALLILMATFWLAWGAAQAALGLWPAPAPQPRRATPRGRCAILVPVHEEDPQATFARIAAMDAALADTPQAGLFDIAILSDTRSAHGAAREAAWYLELLRSRDAEGRIFYRRRSSNAGRKAGNIEDFLKTSGAAYEFALILDADSLMAPDTIIEMARRMEAEPRLGLLQSLPGVIRASSVFGRAMQFSAALHSPIFARGVARLQGETGPFWGHNAMVRVRAFAESCALPDLAGPPPFGGHILSHDYVEAALLARAGWIVRLDEDLSGSFEEGPENILAHAKRDRRWCQGNLQHARLLAAPGLRPWSRFVFVQGILAYVSSLFWLGFLATTILAPALRVEPDYFPLDGWSFPVLPPNETTRTAGLIIGVLGLLILPKLMIAVQAIRSGRAAGFGGAARLMGSTLAEIALSSVTAPIFLMFQTRSVLQVLSGRDGGWPASARGEGRLGLIESWQASRWISVVGLAGLAITWRLSPELVGWLIPVAGPMIAAPLVIWATSLPSRALFAVPSETRPDPILARQDAIMADWSRGPAPGTDETPATAAPAQEPQHV